MNRETTIASIKSKLGELKSSFYIQGGHIAPLHIPQKEFNSISEVFPTLFSERDESAYLFWSEVPIRFHYTYEFYANFDALIELCGKLMDQGEGSSEWILLTDDLIGDLQFDWNAGQLKITGKWKMRKSDSIYAEVLNKKAVINTTTTDFLNEWTILFMQIKNSFATAGIHLTTDDAKDQWKEMNRIIGGSTSLGKLYTR